MAKEIREDKQSGSNVVVTFMVSPDVRNGLDELARDLGLPTRNSLLSFLVQANRNGLLMVMNKAAKESLVGAAEDRLLSKAEKTSRETCLYVLWQEGYRADPYDR